MTCLEAQSKIIAYIENDLERTKKQEFLNHVRECKDCKEELNIYYTMIEGMRQLDENDTLSENFSDALDERMNQELRFMKKKKVVLRNSVLLVLIGIFSIVVMGYVNFLSYLENKEQEELKKQQGNYYYSDTFDKIIFEPYDDMVKLDVNVEQEDTELSFYEKIRQYEYLNK